MTPEISIVSPVYRAEDLVDLLVQRISSAVSAITSSFEIILVEDGGPDNSWAKIEQNCRKYPYVKGLQLSRNFGQHYAIAAGIEHAKGNWVVIMDCDLQDLPEEIPKLYQKACEGYDVVMAKRKDRQDSLLKKTYSKVFYGLLTYMTGTKKDSTIGNFGIYHRKAIDAIKSMHDSVRYFPAMIRWVGYKSTSIDVIHAEREIGMSSYSFRKGINLALDVMLSFSDKPLRLTMKTGRLLSFTAVLFAIYVFIRALRGEIAVMGYASLIVSIWFLFGLTIFILGVVGLYIGKIFERVKERPLFLISKTIN